MPADNNQRSKSFLGVMIIIGSLFFVFGFVTWVNSVLIPYFKLICELSIQQAMLVAFAFYIGYLVMAFPSSIVLKKNQDNPLWFILVKNFWFNSLRVQSVPIDKCIPDHRRIMMIEIPMQWIESEGQNISSSNREIEN